VGLGGPCYSQINFFFVMLNKVFLCEKFYLIVFERIFITFILILHDFWDGFNK
jgi:hypothetical protein